jgi:hypothetical protein
MAMGMPVVASKTRIDQYYFTALEVHPKTRWPSSFELTLTGRTADVRLCAIFSAG